MNTRVEPLRAGLAMVTAMALAFAMILVLGSLPAAAEHVNTWPGTSEANAETFWEGFLNNHDSITGAECTKDETSSDSNFVANAAYRLVVIKQGSGDLANKLYWNVESGDVLPPAQNAPGWSHVIVCTVPVTTTSSTTTTTTVPSTTTTTTVPSTTTTTTVPPPPPPPPGPDTGNIVVTKQVQPGSPQNVEFTFTASGFVLSDNTLAHAQSGSAVVVAGGNYSVTETVLTGWQLASASCTSTHGAADDSTPADINVSAGETVTCLFINAVQEQVAGTIITTSTTVPDEVLDTHVEAEELPFTGIDSELLVGMGVLLLMSGLLVLGVTGREDA